MKSPFSSHNSFNLLQNLPMSESFSLRFRLCTLWKIYFLVVPVALFMILFLLSGCHEQDPDATSSTRIVELGKEGLQMPSFTLPSPLAEGILTSSETLKGKVALVYFFASWCRSCLEEVPLLKSLQTRFGGQSLVIVAMALDRENAAGLANLMQQEKINYQILLADEAVQRDFGGIAILPTIFLVSREGILLKKYLGHGDRGRLIEEIKQALNP